ncbi:MAG: response regulator transcription factor [bacterium]
MKILIIEDEPNIAEPIKKALMRRSIAVDYTGDGKKGLSLLEINKYDCLILDLNLPGLDGLEIAKRMREQKINTPILMLTARTAQKDIWQGFATGTDDYLTKPFDLQELIFRVQALIRRNSKNQDEALSTANIMVKPLSCQVFRDEQEIALNKKEFGILEYLLRNQGKVVSTEELLEHIWDQEIDIFTQTVRTNIKTLRKKVDPEKKIIHTIIGKGYVIR